MKIQIGDKCYESNGKPVILILDEMDKKNISNMTQDEYFNFPNGMTFNDIRMRIGLEPIK